MSTFGPYRGPLRAVIFDWAGTTIDYGSVAPAAAFVELFRRRGVGLTTEQAREPMGAPKRDHIAALLEMPGVASAWARARGAAPTDSDVDALFAEFVPLELEIVPRHADLIPGTLETAAALRARGLKIGSTTGYPDEIVERIRSDAARRGYAPDNCVTPSRVPAGRPAPWMALESARDLGVYPMAAVVKVGDTPLDVAEGLNAGMWTVAVCKTGNELGLTEREAAALDGAELERRLTRARRWLLEAGAHYVIDGIADLIPILDAIDARLARGERP